MFKIGQIDNAMTTLVSNFSLELLQEIDYLINTLDQYLNKNAEYIEFDFCSNFNPKKPQAVIQIFRKYIFDRRGMILKKARRQGVWFEESIIERI